MRKPKRDARIIIAFLLLFGLALTGIGVMFVLRYTVIDAPPAESELIYGKVEVERLRRRSAFGGRHGGSKYYVIEANGAEYILMGEYDKYGIVNEIAEGDTVAVWYSEGVFGDYAHKVKVNGKTVVHYTSHADLDLIFGSLLFGCIGVFGGILFLCIMASTVYNEVFRKTDEELLHEALLQKSPKSISGTRQKLRFKRFSGAVIVFDFVGNGDVMELEINADIVNGLTRLMLVDGDGADIREITLRDGLRLALVTERGKKYCIKLCGARVKGSLEIRGC